MLRPIESHADSGALDVLARGLTRRSRQFWQDSLERLADFGGNRAAGVPLGWLLMAGSAPVGVLLSPASLRTDADGRSIRMINLSSWYIDPDHRWRGPMMLRSAVRQFEAIYTDLTPTPQVQEVLALLGFHRLNAGEVVVALPQAAIGPARGSRVLDLEQAPTGAITAQTRELLSRHRDYGCVALALGTAQRWEPLLFKRTTMRGIPAARLVYCENEAALRRHLAPVARNLLRQGRLLLVLDWTADERPMGLARAGHALKFIKGPLDHQKTDYAGSELALFDLF
jgi:hypothetical protein